MLTVYAGEGHCWALKDFISPTSDLFDRSAANSDFQCSVLVASEHTQQSGAIEESFRNLRF